MKDETARMNKGSTPKETPWNQQKGMAPKNPGVKVLKGSTKFSKGKSH